MIPLFDLARMPAVQAATPVRFEASGPFAMRFDAYRHCKCVAVLRGGFDLHIDGEAAPVRIEEGDCYLLSDGRGYRAFNAMVVPIPAVLVFTVGCGADGIARLGEGPADTALIGARFTFDIDGEAWLHDALPPVVRIPAASAEAARIRAALHELCSEAPADPGEADRIAGIVLVQAMQAANHRDDRHV